MNFLKSSLPLTTWYPKNTQKENIRKQSMNYYTRSILRKRQEKCIVESTFSELAQRVQRFHGYHCSINLHSQDQDTGQLFCKDLHLIPIELSFT